MININFDRPYLLFVAIPLIALVLVPFFIAIRKENKTKSAVISLIIHLVITALITFVAAGTSMTQVITETNVYVVADVSHSANRNLDEIDDYIESIEERLPQNSKMGVIAFGKNYKLITDIDSEFGSVKSSGVDDSATNIKGALEYAGTLFEDDVVKRIILITDGKQTVDSSVSGIASTVDKLYNAGIYIDAIYIDDNLSEEDSEVQITSVDFTPSTYLNLDTKANVLIQSSMNDRVNATVKLFKDGELILTQYPTLTQGYNVVNFTLPTNKSGEYDYKVTVDTDNSSGRLDSSGRNNAYTFTQTVSGKLNVLLITSNDDDVARAGELYGEDAIITSYVNDPAVPCSVEELIAFDQIVLSGVDIRTLNNFAAFVSSVGTVVSSYGKSFITFGDLKLQNKVNEDAEEDKENSQIEDKTNEVLEKLDDMLPVKYGNSDQDPKLVCLVLDVSRSMQTQEKLLIEKAAAKQIIDLLNDHDYLIIITFWGDKTTIWPSSPIESQRDYIKNELIDKLNPQQGTVLGAGMKEAYEKVKSSGITDKQVFLMSDGVTWANEVEDAVAMAKDLYLNGIPTSVLNTNTWDNGTYKNQTAIKLLQDIAREGAGTPDATVEELGNYYFCAEEDDVKDVILAEIADDITETIIEGDIPLSIKIKSDSVLDGITSALPNLNGFVYSRAKASATTVLTADYVKSNGGVSEAPIYAYWQYGDGRVITFTSSLSGKWVDGWTDGVGMRFMDNITENNVPKEKHDVPFRVSIDEDGGVKTLTLTPEILTYGAKASVELTLPSGSVISEELEFNSKNFVYEFTTSTVGKYRLRVIYNPSGTPYETTMTLDIPYQEEYNAFTAFTISDLHKIIRTRGTVYTNAEIDLENKEDDIATYTFFFAIPFMVAAVILYVLDIIVRKLRWADIRNLFGLKEKKNHMRGGANQ